jgi:aspartate/methionine/tyrosine aminotransferase
VNEAAQASSVQPMVNMGQGFFGYNPPQFCIDAAKEALDKVECNQYSPTKVSQLHTMTEDFYALPIYANTTF